MSVFPPVTIRPLKLYNILQCQRKIFLADTRSPTAFRQSHVRGSFNLRSSDQVAAVPPADIIIAIGDCDNNDVISALKDFQSKQKSKAILILQTFEKFKDSYPFLCLSAEGEESRGERDRAYLSYPHQLAQIGTNALYAGHVFFALSLKVLSTLKIKGMLDLTPGGVRSSGKAHSELEAAIHALTYHHHFSSSGILGLPMLRAGTEFLRRALETGNVIVAGSPSTGAAVAAAFLMVHHDWSARTALIYVASLGPDMAVLPLQISVLQQYEEELFKASHTVRTGQDADGRSPDEGERTH